MIVSCPRCATEFALPDNALGKTGRKVKCGGCGHMWLQRTAGPAHAGPSLDSPVTMEPTHAVVSDAPGCLPRDLVEIDAPIGAGVLNIQPFDPMGGDAGGDFESRGAETLAAETLAAETPAPDGAPSGAPGGAPDPALAIAPQIVADNEIEAPPPDAEAAAEELVGAPEAEAAPAPQAAAEPATAATAKPAEDGAVPQAWRAPGLAALAPLVDAIAEDEAARNARAADMAPPAPTQPAVVDAPNPTPQPAPVAAVAAQAAPEAEVPVEPAMTVIVDGRDAEARPAEADAALEGAAPEAVAVAEEPDAAFASAAATAPDNAVPDSAAQGVAEPEPAAPAATAPEAVAPEIALSAMTIIAAAPAAPPAREAPVAEMPVVEVPELEIPAAAAPAREPPAAGPHAPDIEALPPIEIPAPAGPKAILVAVRDERAREGETEDAIAPPPAPVLDDDLRPEEAIAPEIAAASIRHRRLRMGAVLGALALIMGGLVANEMTRPGDAVLLAQIKTGGAPADTGLGFANVNTQRTAVGGVPMLVVTGEVVNGSARPRPVPLLRGALLGGERELQYWTFSAAAPQLEPGQRASFETVLRNPAAGATDVRVTFAVPGG